jgi:hypothetical protein
MSQWREFLVGAALLSALLIVLGTAGGGRFEASLQRTTDRAIFSRGETLELLLVLRADRYQRRTWSVFHLEIEGLGATDLQPEAFSPLPRAIEPTAAGWSLVYPEEVRLPPAGQVNFNLRFTLAEPGKLELVTRTRGFEDGWLRRSPLAIAGLRPLTVTPYALPWAALRRGERDPCEEY